MGSKWQKFSGVLGLVGWLALCFAAALCGMMFPPGTWYAQLHKPTWNPPNWIFTPVWTALYAVMAVAAWRVWRRKGLLGGWRPLGWFLLQLVLNALWSFLFFGLHLPGWAFFEVILLWLAILATARAFHRVDTLAGWLLAPYLAWVAFAAALNGAIWLLNR